MQRLYQCAGDAVEQARGADQHDPRLRGAGKLKGM
jgi:hypothetical protein